MSLVGGYEPAAKADLISFIKLWRERELDKLASFSLSGPRVGGWGGDSEHNSDDEPDVDSAEAAAELPFFQIEDTVILQRIHQVKVTCLAIDTRNTTVDLHRAVSMAIDRTDLLHFHCLRCTVMAL
jgi:hypothetical protein